MTGDSRTPQAPARGTGDSARPRAGSTLREPRICFTPSDSGLTTWNVGDDAAAFGLRREYLELPVIARFTIEGEPVSKARARFTKRGSKTQAYTPEKTFDAEQVVGWQFRRAAPGHRLDPKKAYGVMALFFCGKRQRRDVDNMLKLILDGLNGVAWPDDEQVTEVSAKKTLTLPENARTEVIVYQIGFMQQFTKDCIQCGREFLVFKSTSNQQHCTLECAMATRRQEAAVRRTCEGCGAAFGGGSKRKYCSRDCKYANGRITVACTGCGAEFTKQKCHLRGKNFCSSKCRDATNRERRQQQARGTCETCGGSTSKKSYRQCNACRVAGTSVNGRPKAVAIVIDGIVEAGVLPDDACPRYVEAIEDTVGEPYPRGRLVLHIAEVAAEAPAGAS